MSTKIRDGFNYSSDSESESEPESKPESEPIRHYILDLVIDHQLPRLTKEECYKLGLSHTDKTKHVLGVCEDHSVIWSWPNFNPADHKMISNVTKSYGLYDIRELGARVFMQWVEDNRDQLVIDSQAYAMKDLSVEQAESNLAKLLRQVADVQKMIDAAKLKSSEG